MLGCNSSLQISWLYLHRILHQVQVSMAVVQLEQICTDSQACIICVLAAMSCGMRTCIVGCMLLSIHGVGSGF